ncbi:hypothetical protein D3C71_1642600 [compost metagenome]
MLWIGQVDRDFDGLGERCTRCTAHGVEVAKNAVNLRIYPRFQLHADGIKRKLAGEVNRFSGSNGL